MPNIDQQPKRLNKLLLGATQPNEAQLKLYSSTAADLAKAMFLASWAAVFVPSKEGAGILLGIAGLITSAILFITASRFLKEVKEK